MDPEHCGSLQPRGSLYFPAKCFEIEQSQFKLNHALRPGLTWRKVATFLSAPDPNEAIYQREPPRLVQKSRKNPATRKNVSPPCVM